MALTTGSRVGPYEVTGSLGAGGMGEVYRARDTRLKREVALKILPQSFAADPESARALPARSRGESGLAPTKCMPPRKIFTSPALMVRPHLR